MLPSDDEPFSDYIINQFKLHIVTGRYSRTLQRQLESCLEHRTLNIFQIFDEIGLLEGGTSARGTRTKPATKFNRLPLRGLWHKHFAQAGFIPLNVRNHWERNDFEARVSEIIKDSKIPAEKKLDAAIHAFVLDGYTARAAATQLTGEWIVFARESDVNYYLTLASHNEHDEAIFARVAECRSDFPQLNFFSRQSLEHDL